MIGYHEFFGFQTDATVGHGINADFILVTPRDIWYCSGAFVLVIRNQLVIIQVMGA